MKLKIQNLEHLQGRIGIFGDLHGVWDETIYAIKELQLDWVVSLGDVSDRGPKVFELYDLLISNPNYFAVMGNHDHKLLRYFHGESINSSNRGFQSTLEQLLTKQDLDRSKYINYLENLPHIIKLPHRIVAVHAGLDPTKSLRDQDWKQCLKIRSFNPKHPNNVNNNKDPRWFDSLGVERELLNYRIVFGHSQFEKIEVRKNVFALDGGAVFGNELRVMVLDTSANTESFHVYPCKMYYKKTDF